MPSTAPPEIALDSFANDFTAVVVGASGGVGGALVQALAKNKNCGRIYAFSRSGQTAAQGGSAKIMQARMDAANPDSIESGFAAVGDKLDLVVCATGVLHGDAFGPEKSWRQIEAEAFAEVLAVNVTGPALVAKTALDKLAKGRKTAFAALSARVGSISDNRLGGWHAYRASKAALNMLIRNFAIELARRNKHALAVGLHPGTVDTALSKPFQANVKDGALFTPEYSAACLLNVLNGLTSEESGGVYAWDGALIPT